MEDAVLINYESNVIQTSGYFYPTWEILCTSLESEETVVPITQSEIPAEEIAQSSESGRKRKKERKSGRDFYKKARNSGKSYVKYEGKDKKCEVKEKVLGPDCECPSKCFEKVGQDTIRKIFRDFWALSDYNSQNAYLFGLINLIGVKRRYTKSKVSRRNFTITYCVKKKGQNVTVCKKAFLNIHGLQRNRGRVNNLTNKMKEGESVPPPDRRGRHKNRPNAYSEEAIEHVRRHLVSCPKVDRKKVSKQVGVSTKRCYDLYVNEYCRDNALIPVSLDKFRRIFSMEGYKNRCRGFHKSGK